MIPRPDFENENQKPNGKFQNKNILITGGDSGIGRAVGVAFAKEGANVAIVYLSEHKDALDTETEMEKYGAKTQLIYGDLGKHEFCKEVVNTITKEWKQIDVLVNNAAEQRYQENFLNISPEQLLKTFQTNFFSFVYLTQNCLPYMKKGSSIINTASVTAYRGSEHLVDYASTKGAIVAFTRSLAKNLANKKIRVNAVAPGPVWTPLIPSTFPKSKLEDFGKNVPLGRPGQPDEIAPSYLFLADEKNSYMTGQVLHPNGGEIVNT